MSQLLDNLHKVHLFREEEMHMNDKIDKLMNTPYFKVFCILDSVVGLATAFFAENNGVIKVIFIIATVIMFIVGCLLAFRYSKFVEVDKKNTALMKDIEILEQKIHNGVKYTNNEVIVTLDKKQSLYRFEFIKEFEVISDDAPKWYSAQFYANKILKDKEQSKEYYKSHIIKWNDLKVRASVSYKKPDAQNYSQPKSLVIYNITDECNYIPFNIQYITYNGNRVLDIVKGTSVRLKYCYNVPVDLWGSYLNRSISYFGEPSKVKLRYDIGTEFDIKVSLLSSSDGKPMETDDFEMIRDEENEYNVCTITLKPQSHAKYRIWWDSEKYFANEETTEDTADSSQLTNN